MTFRAPVRDLVFSLTEAAEASRLIETGAFPEFDLDTAEAVLTAAGRFAEEVLAPLNRTGDQEGARLENGQVIPRRRASRRPTRRSPKAAGTASPPTRPMAARACPRRWSWRCSRWSTPPTWPSASARC